MPVNQLRRYQAKPNVLAGRTIIVTGAGDGLGRSAARAFAAHAADLILIGRTRSKLEQVNDEIRDVYGRDSLIVPLDLATLNEQLIEDLRTGLAESYEKIDGLLHNAGVLGPKTTLEHYPITAWMNAFEVNVHSTLKLTQSVLPIMKNSPDASIIFTSSGLSKTGRAYWGSYCATKFALEGLMEVLAEELGTTTDIRVNSLNPGAVRTAMRAQAFPAEDPQTLPHPDERMSAYLYLMGPDSKGVNRQSFYAGDWEPISRF